MSPCCRCWWMSDDAPGGPNPPPHSVGHGQAERGRRRRRMAQRALYMAHDVHRSNDSLIHDSYTMEWRSCTMVTGFKFKSSSFEPCSCLGCKVQVHWSKQGRLSTLFFAISSDNVRHLVETSDDVENSYRNEMLHHCMASTMSTMIEGSLAFVPNNTAI